MRREVTQESLDSQDLAPSVGGPEQDRRNPIELEPTGRPNASSSLATGLALGRFFEIALVLVRLDHVAKLIFLWCTNMQRQ